MPEGSKRMLDADREDEQTSTIHLKLGVQGPWFVSDKNTVLCTPVFDVSKSGPLFSFTIIDEITSTTTVIS